MEYKKLLTGDKMPALGLGTWKIGGDTVASTINDASEVAAIKKAIELGYTLIDTAESYGAGHTEELVGKAIKGAKRKDLFLVSKVAKTNLHYAKVIEACKNSLKRLGTDYLDLYLIHAPNPAVPLEETLKAMNFLVKEGLTKDIGLSAFSLELLKEAQAKSESSIVANQIEYSLFSRNIGYYGASKNMEKEVIPYQQKEGIITMSVRPLERGLLLENKTIQEIAKKYKKTPAQVSLNWLIQKEGVVALPKAVKEEHLRDNLGALGWKLKKEDLLELDKLKEIDNFKRI